MAAPQTSARTQAERTASTKKQLVDAAIAALLEHGYARTTAVEVCGRAGLTRGAYHHHYACLGELLADALDAVYERLTGPASEIDRHGSLEGLLRRAFRRISQPEFRVVLELWIANRNDPALAPTLGAAIEDLAQRFEPSANPDLATVLRRDPEAIALYRLAFEASIGLALGRATSPDGRPVAHERQVTKLLFALAREWDERAAKRTP